MSGFDNLMRTDEHNARNRQFYDQQRYQSDRATAQTISNIPGQMQQAQMNQQAMEQQQLQSALMEKQVDADMRMQEVVMEQQLHRNKMATAMELDQMSLSRLNVESTKISIAQQQLALEEQREASSAAPQNAHMRISLAAVKAIPTEKLAAMGYQFSPETGLARFSSDEQRDEFLATLKSQDEHSLEGRKEARLQGETEYRKERDKSDRSLDVGKLVASLVKPNSLGESLTKDQVRGILETSKIPITPDIEKAIEGMDDSAGPFGGSETGAPGPTGDQALDDMIKKITPVSFGYGETMRTNLARMQAPEMRRRAEQILRHKATLLKLWESYNIKHGRAKKDKDGNVIPEKEEVVMSYITNAMKASENQNTTFRDAMLMIMDRLDNDAERGQ